MASSARNEVRVALETIRSSTANRKPLTYAPWVLALGLVVAMRDRVPGLDAGDWAGVLAGITVLGLLGRIARRSLARQAERAQDRLAATLRSGRGMLELSELRAQPRYRGVALSHEVQQALIHAMVRQERLDEERRVRTERERISARRTAAVG